MFEDQVNLPSELTHCSTAESEPLHTLPPWDGEGLSHRRFLILHPPPDKFEHEDQCSQSDQAPST